MDLTDQMNCLIHFIFNLKYFSAILASAYNIHGIWTQKKKICIILVGMCFWMSAYRCEKAYDFPWSADRSVREKRTTDGYWHSGRSGHIYVRGENIAVSDLSISFDYNVIIYQVHNKSECSVKVQHLTF